MNKERIKGIVIGFILCAILSAGVAATANTTVTRQITYGINVILNGQQMQFAEDSRPFVMDNRTFLPLRAMSEMLGFPVDFDPATNTAIVGNRNQGVRTPLNTAAPFYDKGGTGVYTNVVVSDSVNMGGTAYRNALVFGTQGWSRSAFSLHNLNGQARLLTGHIGRVDGQGMYNATFNFYGDGVLLQTYDQRAADLPTPISVFVEGVQQLKIEVVASYALYALAGFLE